MSIIGILVGLVLPAVQQVRASSRQTQCLNNIRQLSLAAQNYLDTKRQYPNATVIYYGTSWGTELLEFLEAKSVAITLNLKDQGPEYDNYWDNNDNNEAACSFALPIFKCPSDPSPNQLKGENDGIENRAISSYLAVGSGNLDDYRNFEFDTDFNTAGEVQAWRSGVIVPTQPADPRTGTNPALKTRVRTTDITDGLSNTVMFGETIFDISNMTGTSTSYGADHWILGSPSIDENGSDLSEHVGSTAIEFNYYQHLTDQQISAMASAEHDAAARKIAAGFASWHAGDGVNFAFADGSSRYLSSDIDDELRKHIGMRNDGGVVGSLE